MRARASTLASIVRAYTTSDTSLLRLLHLVFSVLTVIPLLFRGQTQQQARYGRSDSSGAWFTLASDLMENAAGETPELADDPPNLRKLLTAEELQKIAALLQPDSDIRTDPFDLELIKKLMPAPVLISPHIHCVFCSTPEKKVVLHTKSREKVQVCTHPFRDGRKLTLMIRSNSSCRTFVSYPPTSSPPPAPSVMHTTIPIMYLAPIPRSMHLFVIALEFSILKRSRSTSMYQSLAEVARAPYGLMQKLHIYKKVPSVSSRAAPSDLRST